MQPVLIKISSTEEVSFSVNKYMYADKFPGIWHYHPQYELTLILKSRGTRFVGDNIDLFQEGDLIFIGENLPHNWINDGKVEEKDINGGAQSFVIHFFGDFLGDRFFKIPEMTKVQQLFEKSKRGLKIIGKTRDTIIKELQGIEPTEGAEKLIRFLSILKLLSQSSDLVELSSEGFSDFINQSDSERLNRVYKYIMSNFREDINLIKVASIAYMSPTAFSRYFKNRTRKSFSQFLIELKIGYACKLLMKEEFTVSQACYESGFNNLSNFNRQFKKFTKQPPKKYQLLHNK